MENKNPLIFYYNLQKIEVFLKKQCLATMSMYAISGVNKDCDIVCFVQVVLACQICQQPSEQKGTYGACLSLESLEPTKVIILVQMPVAKSSLISLRICEGPGVTSFSITQRHREQVLNAHFDFIQVLNSTVAYQHNKTAEAFFFFQQINRKNLNCIGIHQYSYRFIS